MADNLTEEQRRKTMSRIRSKWTVQEKKIHNHLKARKVRHKMHPDIEGSPDILLKDSNTILFLHGCFWHKCLKCYSEPETNKEYWLPKIERNVQKDKENTKKAKKHGYKVITIWEHEIKKNLNKVVSKITKGL